MNSHFKKIILKATDARKLYKMDDIQTLWSGYGKIVRYGLKDSDLKSIVVKHVRPPEKSRHPAGWNTNLSHQRKVKSYQVETAWYGRWSGLCNEVCRVPRCLALETREEEVLIVLEDLDASGFPERRIHLSMDEINVGLEWLAEFHAIFMGEKPDGLWKTGTYWHLETRPDELESLSDTVLKNAAGKIDKILKKSPFQTFVHGDAKLENFNFSPDGKKTAMVDFQYVGGGCGMKDVAYFISSCLHEDDCEKMESILLDYYFGALKTALIKHKKPVNPDEVEDNWRKLYHTAWTDFYRFLQGWAPGYWGNQNYSRRLAREVIAQLDGNPIS